jgi:hypothetical protein
MRSLLLILTLFLHQGLLAQLNPGAREISMAGSLSPVGDDVFSLFNNPAGIGETGLREAGIYYSPSPYGFKEMVNAFGAYCEPFQWGTVAVGAMTYGFKLYKETKISAGTAYRYSDNLIFGAAANWHNVSIERYGHASAFYFNAGTIFYPASFLRAGFFIQNINNASFASYKDQIPVVITTGLAAEFNDVVLAAAIEKDVRYKPSLSAGIEYNLIRYFALRLGFGNEPARFCGGFAVNYSVISFSYAAYNHNELGLTHQIDLKFAFSKYDN